VAAETSGAAPGADGAPGRLAAGRWARLARHPLLAWLGRWGVSAWSLILGCLTLFVFRRGLPHVGWIIGYLLLLWLLWAGLTALRAPLLARGVRGATVAVGATEYAIQTLYHNLLLFVLPAYYASATLDSANAVFLAGVGAGALVTAVDPWYRRVIRPRPWVSHALFGFAIFAALNVALPLVGVPPIRALLLAAALSGLALTPEIRRRGGLAWPGVVTRAALLAAAATALVWYGRALVPPAPLFVSGAVLARTVAGLEPVDAVPGGRVAAAVVGEWAELTAFTPVHAPSGLRQPIAHVWSRDGAEIARIPLSPVLGGRAQGFRTWSRRRDLRPPLDGRYAVDVVTSSGQLIGRLRFTVTP
jgi:hypothetical protein